MGLNVDVGLFAMLQDANAKRRCGFSEVGNPYRTGVKYVKLPRHPPAVYSVAPTPGNLLMR